MAARAIAVNNVKRVWMKPEVRAVPALPRGNCALHVPKAPSYGMWAW